MQDKLSKFHSKIYFHPIVPPYQSDVRLCPSSENDDTRAPKQEIHLLCNLKSGHFVRRSKNRKLKMIPMQFVRQTRCYRCYSSYTKIRDLSEKLIGSPIQIKV